MDGKKQYFKPILCEYGDAKKITQDDGDGGNDGLTGSYYM